MDGPVSETCWNKAGGGTNKVLEGVRSARICGGGQHGSEEGDFGQYAPSKISETMLA